MAQIETTNGLRDDISTGEAAEFPPLLPQHATRIISVDENGLREILFKLRQSEQYIADLAAKLGVSPQLLGDTLLGKRPIGAKLQRAMGVVRVYQMFDLEVLADED